MGEIIQTLSVYYTLNVFADNVVLQTGVYGYRLPSNVSVEEGTLTVYCTNRNRSSTRTQENPTTHPMHRLRCRVFLRSC